MFKIHFFLIFVVKIIYIKSESLLISDDAFDSLYIHTADQTHVNLNENLKIERKNFCIEDGPQDDHDFIEKIIFGLISDDDRLMKKCFDENYEHFVNLTTELDDFVTNKVSSASLNGTNRFNPYVAIRRASIAFKHDYIFKILKYMDRIESVCMLRTNNTAGRSYYAEQMAERIASGDYQKAADNFKNMESTALAISTLKFAMNWNDDEIVQKIMIVFNILLKSDQIEHASTLLVTIFGILLIKNEKNSWASVIIAEETKLALEKLKIIPITNFEYKPTRKKLKFIIVHLPKSVRSIVWEIPRNRTNFCIQNKKFETYLFLKERQRQREIFSGTKLESGSEFIKQSVFRLYFNQSDFSYEMISDYYNDGFLTHTPNDPKISTKDNPERWYFDPAGDGSFLIRTDSYDKSGRNKFLYLVDNVDESKPPRSVKMLMDITKDLKKYSGEERWFLESC